MLKIKLDDIGRRFNRDWIFKHINYEFNQGNSYAILGPNGSGKSTLLQVLAGSLSPSQGKISYFKNDRPIEIESVFRHLALAAPYLELIEEFTLRELITYHFRFKKPLSGWSTEKIVDFLGLRNSADKEIRNFSSGMKQRTKLALACCSDTPILFLDEPTANLDAQGIDWYYALIDELASDRLLVICSNQPHEYRFCTDQLLISDFK